MNATPDTGLELYLQEPQRSGRATTLALSVTLHVLAAAGFVFVHFSAVAPAAIPWRPQAVMVAPALPRQTRLKEKPRKLTPRENTIAPLSRVETRAFHAPITERKPEPVLRPVDAPPTIAPPPVTSPITAALPSVTPHLPVLPAPPMKTDNLSAAATMVAATNGKVESAGFASSGVVAHTAPSSSAPSVGAFGATTVDARASADRLRVSQGTFGNASAAAAHAQSDAPRAIADTPIEILEKPKPKYTEEATRLRIEGEVLVEALFPASGSPRVLRVIRGLGHGLDENASVAAQSIRFRAATRAGQPVDSTAVVHIVFQIAF